MENIGWLIAGGMFITILPFTKVFIMPLNNELKAVEESKEKGMHIMFALLLLLLLLLLFLLVVVVVAVAVRELPIIALFAALFIAYL